MPVRKHWTEIEWPNGVPAPERPEPDKLVDPVLRHLQRENTLAAIAQGIAVGQAVIAEILSGGPAVLGPKPKTEQCATTAHDKETR